MALRLFLRGWLIVTITAANVVFVSDGRWSHAFVSGTLLSWVWWSNVYSASHPTFKGAGLIYGLGAGTGTLTGMLIGRIL